MKEITRRQLLKDAVFLGGTVSLSSFLGCANKSSVSLVQIQEDIIKQRGLYGDLPLVDLRGDQDPRPSNATGGGIMFFSGTYKELSTGMVRFAWKTKEPNPSLIFSTLPESQVSFPTTDQEDPTVEFVFDYPRAKAGFASSPAMDSLNHSDYLDPDNSNNLGRVRLMVAKIKMNRSTYYDWTGIKNLNR